MTIAAPSGAGKTSLVRALIDSVDNLHVSVSYTTRAPRDGEQNHKDYNFISHAEFQSMIEAEDLLEHAQVFDHYYGTSASWVKEELSADKNVILEIDWQGVRQIKQLFPQSQRVFILPPSIEVLKQRLQARGKDSQKIIAKRLAQARQEIAHYHESDFVLINDDFAETLSNLQHIVINGSLPDEFDYTAPRTLAEELLNGCQSKRI